jgi:hypothetical protein
MSMLWIPGGPLPAPGQGGQGPRALLDELLSAAERYPAAVSVVLARDFLVDSARGRSGAPGRITLRCDDDVVLSLKGPAAQQKWKVIMVAIRQEAIDRAASPIIVPGELGGGGR